MNRHETARRVREEAGHLGAQTAHAGAAAARMTAHSVGHGARWAHERATEGTDTERRTAAGTAVVAAVVLAIVTGVFASLAVGGSAWAALLVIVSGVALGMAVLAAVVLATRGATATTTAVVPTQSRQLGRDLAEAAEVLGLGGPGSPVGLEALGRWLGTTPATVEAWIDGRETVPEQQQHHVHAFIDMATTLADNMRPERLPVILATRPVLMLGGRTYFQALNDGAPLEVVADSARLTIGADDVETDAARAYVSRRSRVLWSPEDATASTTPARKPRRRTAA